MPNIFTSFFTAIGHWFSSSRGQSILKQIEAFAVEAEPLVEAISSLVPNRTFQEVNSAYEKYMIPFAMTESQISDPIQQGLALRDLATSVLKKNHQDASATALNAAVELALAHVKTK